jgi:hypothetical protein
MTGEPGDHSAGLPRPTAKLLLAGPRRCPGLSSPRSAGLGPRRTGGPAP